MPEDSFNRLESFSRVLRRTRQSAGVSLSVLAARVHYSKGHLSKVENGLVPANHDFAKACDEALGAGGALIGAFTAEQAAAPATRRRSAASAPFDVPAAPNHFVGRSSELDAICAAVLARDAIGRAPTVLIHGMAGAGKTSLALHAAHRIRAEFPDGCLFIDFSRHPDPGSADDVLRWLLRRLDVTGDAIPVAEGEVRAFYLSVLNRRRILIIADNVHHSDQVKPLVPGSPGCALIVTSRRRLNALDDARSVRIGPLATSESVELFRAVEGASAATEHDPDLRRVAAACGGLPLALRVAAARFRSSGSSTAELVARLERTETAWAALDDSERSVYRTLHAVFEDLSATQQLILSTAALHPGGELSAHACAWLAGLPLDVIRPELQLLNDHDLMAWGTGDRYRLHELVRKFAGQLAGDGSGKAALARLVSGYTATAALADRQLSPMRYQPPPMDLEPEAEPVAFATADEAREWCARELDQIVAVCEVAYDLGMDEECWRLAYAMRGYFFRVKAVSEWLKSHRVALQAAVRRADPWAEAVTRNNLGLAMMEQGRVASAETEYHQAMRILRGLGDEAGVATTLGHQAWARYVDGQFAEAVSLGVEAVELFRRNGLTRGMSIVCRTVALALAKQADHAGALRYLKMSMDLQPGLGSPPDLVMTLNCLGEVHCAMGSLDAARGFHTDAARLARECGSRSEHARALEGLAAVAFGAGQTGLGDRLLDEAIAAYADFHPLAAERLAARRDGYPEPVLPAQRLDGQTVLRRPAAR